MMRPERKDRDEYEEQINLYFNEGERHVQAFLTNFKTRTYMDIEESEQKMALLCYFQHENGEIFKAYYPFCPYFYVGFEARAESQVKMYIESKVPRIFHLQTVDKVDLQEINHLSGRLKKYIKISFRTNNDLANARKFLDIRKKKAATDTQLYFNTKKNVSHESPKQFITDIREYDVPYHVRVCIDANIRAGKWYSLQMKGKFIKKISPVLQKRANPDLKIIAYDIQTSKAQFKFPQKQKDVVIMISMMYEEQAVLIINGGFCQQKVQDFTYEPEGKQQFNCNVTVFNMNSQKQTLQKFSDIIKFYKPAVITSFNGDRFDYPFLQARFAHHQLNFYKMMGVQNKSQEYYGAFTSHLDCYYWVDRDAYLPQGSRGLKAVTRAKLKYEPIQVNPQDMVEMAIKKTKDLARYSVSDAVATFYLYMKHIHGFIYALSTIIPMMPDEVLRKGSGTLCENLLMAEAFARNIIFPNKQMEVFQKFYKGHLLDTETYTGGKVECLRSGVYRSDFPTDFTLSPKAFQDLIDTLEQIIQFSVRQQAGEKISSIENLEQVKSTLTEALKKLRDVPTPSKYETLPLIYHIDVAAMYPNIIITNRLQPVAVVNDHICSGCLFNSPEYQCKRPLEWEWRGEYFPLTQGEFSFIKEKETMKIDPNAPYNKLDVEKGIKDQVKKYSQRIYSKTHISVTQVRRDTVCMRQNSFYVDTVRAFRDRRYDFKRLTKLHKTISSQKAKQGDFEGQKQQIKLMELYESMQLAHKIILNSFYGYVMRKGSRWYSMETAAMVTYIGSNIINDSKNFIEAKIGKPLQLDTDGIWMLLPAGFPEEVKIKFRDGKTFNMSYPCQILNHLIHDKYENPQYQQLKDQVNFQYDIRKQMTIAFQIDGPYKAMFIPGGKEKKKTTELDIQQHSTQMLKKRYVVFNHKNVVTEFKGLEMKRRGELNIIKMFQSQIFSEYVKGNTLKECYQCCAKVAMKFFNQILNKGAALTKEGVFERFQQSKNLSKDVNEYGETKGVAISAAKRLADFLGPQIVKGKNLCLYYIISAYPPKRPVTQRAIPTQIFQADMELQKKFLYKWTNQDSFKTHVDIRNVLDWDYYKERLSTQIQKMVCIPAVMQNLPNPIPQIDLPDWLQKKTFDMRHHRQQKISMYGFGFQKDVQNQYMSEKKNQSALKSQNDLQNSIEPKKLFDENKNSFMRKNNKNPFSMKKNFKQWLGEQKRIWKNHKRDFDEIKHESFQKQKYILEVASYEGTPGLFIVWYYSGKKIQSLLLNFSRHYSVKDPKGLKKAPREEGNATQIIIDEKQFLKNENYYDSILGKTFYQTKMPLIISLIIRKGNLWQFTNKSIYMEQDIHEVFGAQYLPKIQQSFMPIVYLSQMSSVDMKSKGIYSVFSPKTVQYFFVFLDNTLQRNVDELLKVARKNIGKDNAKITIKIKNTEMQLGRQINQILKSLNKTIKETYLVVLESVQDIHYLQNIGIRQLQAQVPVLKLQGTQLGKGLLFDWKKILLKSSIQQSKSLQQKILNLLEWSRFSSIPLCNLPYSQKLLDFITNITYSRLLYSGDNLTWWNDYNSEIVQTYQSKTQTGRIINPCLNTSYCIQINIDNMAVNTIANSDELVYEDREAAMMIQKNKKEGQQVGFKYLDQMTQAKKGFEYLKKMIKGWLIDLNVNLYKANDLLSNFHKWITTYSNALYDPLLLKIVNELMKSMFSILIKKFNNMGLQIIYASFSKIIVGTGKHTYIEAQNTINYVMKKCKDDNQKLFSCIVMRPLENYYRVLLYKDPQNFIGIFINQIQGKNEMVNNKQSLMQSLREEEQQNSDSAKIEFKLQISKLFNPITKAHFDNLILTFVNSLGEIKKKLVKDYRDNKMKLMLNYNQLIIQRTVEYIQNQFSDFVLLTIEEIQKIWQQKKLKWHKKIKQQEEGAGQQEQDVENSSSENEEDQSLDQFIVDDDEDEDQDQESMQQQSRSRKKNKQSRKRAKKNKKKEKDIFDIDFSVWKDDKQLDIMTETLFKLLNCEQTSGLYETFDNLRSKCLRKINSQPSCSKSCLNPEYPYFQLPCSRCYLINQKPGECSHCGQHLQVKTELENSVWKMLQQQGRDLYCNRCNDILRGYLKKCICGGTWVLKQHPLSWLPYVDRTDSAWEYCNKVFEFMGIQGIKPTN